MNFRDFLKNGEEAPAEEVQADETEEVQDSAETEEPEEVKED